MAQIWPRFGWLANVPTTARANISSLPAIFNSTKSSKIKGNHNNISFPHRYLPISTVPSPPPSPKSQFSLPLFLYKPLCHILLFSKASKHSPLHPPMQLCYLPPSLPLNSANSHFLHKILQCIAAMYQVTLPPFLEYVIHLRITLSTYRHL